MWPGVWSVVRVLNAQMWIFSIFSADYVYNFSCCNMVTTFCCAGTMIPSVTGPELWGTKLAWRYDQWVVVVYYWPLSCNCLSWIMFGQDILYVTRHIIDVNCCNAGVGVYEKEKAASDWTVNTHVFDNILKNLNLVLTHYPVKSVFTYAWNLQKSCWLKIKGCRFLRGL